MYPRFSEAEFARRYADVRAAMQEANLTALLLYRPASAYHEVLYLSNFPVTREAMLVFPLEGEPTLFVQYFNHVLNARQVACIADVRWGGAYITVTAAENLRVSASTPPDSPSTTTWYTVSAGAICLLFFESAGQVPDCQSRSPFERTGL